MNTLISLLDTHISDLESRIRLLKDTRLGEVYYDTWIQAHKTLTIYKHKFEKTDRIEIAIDDMQRQYKRMHLIDANTKDYTYAQYMIKEWSFFLEIYTSPDSPYATYKTYQ